MTTTSATTTPLRGQSIVAGESVPGAVDGPTFVGVDPSTGDELAPSYAVATPEQVDAAVAAAIEAFVVLRATAPAARAALLRAIADNLDEVRDELVARAHTESGLPVPRLTGEVGRTSGQLRLFATELELGEHQGVRVDHAQPDRTPVPAPDLRLRFVPVGPVVVFGASNFPLAFSTAGGDTASALAAGCPVIVKAHNAHPGTAELVGAAVAAAVRAAGLPAGTFSLLYGIGNDLGQRLVTEPAVKAVGFTGSRAGGLALVRAAQGRPVPIPVYAEMSSINPVIVLPERAGLVDTVADGYVGSLTLGAGQFCTNPGLLFVPAGAGDLVDAIGERVAAAAGQTMLTPGIRTAYESGTERLAACPVVARGTAGDGPNAPAPVVVSCTAAELRANPALTEEVFGAAGLVVRYADLDDLAATIVGLEGQLTATVQAAEGDHDAVRGLLPLLEDLAGRVVMNGWPTGVEVGHAMVHGGPFPATSDPRTTSVGSLAIQRFQRPVAYQDLPESLLPAAVQDANPYRLPRRVDGKLEN